MDFCCGSVYANWTPSVTWSLLDGLSTGDVSSTNVIPGRKGGGVGKLEVRVKGREEGRGEHTERGRHKEHMEDGRRRNEGGRGTKRGWFLPQSLLSCTISSDWSVCGVSSGGGWEAR